MKDFLLLLEEKLTLQRDWAQSDLIDADKAEKRDDFWWSLYGRFKSLCTTLYDVRLELKNNHKIDKFDKLVDSNYPTREVYGIGWAVGYDKDRILATNYPDLTGKKNEE